MREPEETVQARIQATRDRMGDTIEQIGDRVNPDRVQRELKNRAREQMDEFKSNVKRKARGTMRNVEHGVTERGRGLWAAIKENPIPAGMIGVGAAWLMANGRSHDDQYRPGDRYYRDPTGLGDYGAPPTGGYAGGHAEENLQSRAERGTPGAYSAGFTGSAAAAGAPIGADADDESGGRMEQARDRASNAADNAREKGQEAMHAARDKGTELADRGREAMHDVRDRAGDLAGRAQAGARRAEHRIEDTVRENPMAAGAIAAAIGFAAGMMIPETRKEHEIMGPTRDRMLDRAQSEARRATSRARETARETAGKAARNAVDQVWAGDEETQRENISEPRR